MILGKSHIRQIILEQMNKEANNEKIQSLASSLASELKNLSQKLKNSALTSDSNGKQEMEEGAFFLGISIAAALPKILETVSHYAAKFGATQISVGLQMWADDLHHMYMGAIKAILNLVPEYRKAPPDVQKRVADTVFIVIVAMLTAASAQALLSAISQLSLSITIPIETALIKIKSGEIKQYLNEYVSNELKAYKK